MFQQVSIDVAGEVIGLFNVHLQAPQLPARWHRGSLVLVAPQYETSIQDDELERLLGELDLLQGPVVVAGDLNMTDQSPGYKELTRRLGDAHREVGWGLGLTFPDREARRITSPFPLMRIDYILHSRDITAHRAYVGDRGGPTHRYVVAELSF